MRRTAYPIIVVLVLTLSASLSMGAETPRADSTHGIPRERLMEFWEAYTVSSMHYGDNDVPIRIVGYFGRLDSTGSAFNAAMGFIEAKMCQGLKVVNGHLNFAITPYGSIEVINGRYYPDVQVSVKPQIDSMAAIGIVRDSLTHASGETGALECGLSILPRGGSFLLVWQVDQPDRPGRIEPMFVDAHSGEILPRRLF
jgi:hypothetical protein